MGPPKCHILIPRTCKYITLHGKRDVVDVLQFIILQWIEVLDYPGGPNVITSVIRRRQKFQSQRRI